MKGKGGKPVARHESGGIKKWRTDPVQEQKNILINRIRAQAQQDEYSMSSMSASEFDEEENKVQDKMIKYNNGEMTEGNFKS
jgi:hypothetical protein